MDLFRWLRPILFTLPPERAHRLIVHVLKHLPLPNPAPDPPSLATSVAGLPLPNPIGLAAGFDKDAEVIGPLFRLGFGFVEVGTLTPQPQSGNPKPRMARLVEDRAIINRLGFNNHGQAAALARLAAHRIIAGPGIVGINIGANKDAADRIGDYADGVARMAESADYLTINISSPNTPGLRTLQTGEALKELLARTLDPRPSIPVFLKIAPDLEPGELEMIAESAIGAGISGIIATNTTLARPSLHSPLREFAGGLSGAPLFARSTEILLRLRRLTAGRLALIGVGGIASGADAYAKIRAGADAVQLYTGLVYGGPGLVGRIKADIVACLKRDGLARLADAVGIDA